MDIKGNSLFSQMQSMQSMSIESMGKSLPMSDNAVPAVNKSGSDFGSMLKGALDSVNDIQKESGEMRTAFEMGDRSVTLSDTMVAASKASLAFDATVQVRNKFVEAYKEIMNMPV